MEMRDKVHPSLLPLFAVLFALCSHDNTVQEKKYQFQQGPETEAVSRGLNVPRQVAPPGSGDQTDIGKERILHAALLRNGKMPIPQTLSQVNHCKGVNNATEYKSVRQFFSAYIFEKAARAELLKYHQDGSEWEAEYVFNPQRDS